MKKYIDFNTKKRMNAANDFEKDFFKINHQFCLWKNNGKFAKNNQCEISKQWKRFLKYISRPTYITRKIFGKEYAAIHEIKPVLILNKPIYIGFTVLDLSK